MEGAKSGVNFAGHYHIVTFGCGTSCQTGYIIDEKTGEIYDLGFGGEDQTYLNLDSKPDSALVRASYFDGNACRTEASVWDGSRFTSIARRSTPASADAAVEGDCPTINDPTATVATSNAASEAPTTPLAQAAVEPQQITEESMHQPGTSVASEQRQSKIPAQQPQENSDIESAAGQMLADGQACFSRQDYTCAITNATDALRIKPSLDAAKSLRSRAQAAQSQAMNNIDIH